MAKKLFIATDEPDSRDYPFSDYEEFAQWEDKIPKRPKDEIQLFNQWSKPSCTMHAGMHIVNAMNIIEDKRLWLNRKQVDPLEFWDKFCKERGNYDTWTAIQTIANRMKKNWLIEWYVTIGNNQESSEIEKQVDRALAMWGFIYTGSAFGDWTKIKKTGIYSESANRVFLWHAWDIVIERKDGDYYWCLNSYWDTRWPYNWYFKLHRNDLKNIYSKIVFIDKDDSHLFSRFEEIQKVKQAVELLRKVYNSTTLDGVKNFLEKQQLWQNLSTLYWIVI